MSDPTLATRALGALRWAYGGAAARAVLQLGVQMVLARWLGPDAFGQATAAMLVLSIGWLMSEFGFGSALVQKEELTEHDIGCALGWVLLVSGLTGLAAVLSAPWLAAALGDATLTPLVRACGALIPLQALSNIPVSLLRRNLDMKRAQVIYLGGYLLAYGAVGLPLAAMGAGPWSLVAAFGMHALVNFAGSWWVVRHTLRPRLRGAAALRRFGLQVTLTNAAGWAVENVDRFMIQRLWGSATTGSYAAAASLSRAPASFLTSALQTVLLSSTARLQNDTASAARALLAAIALLAALSCPVFWWLGWHADTVVHAIYGERWTQAGPLFRALCATVPCIVLMSVAGPVLWALDAVTQDLRAQLLGVAGVIIGLALLATWPIEQAVWAVPVVYTARASLMLRAVRRRLSLGWAEVGSALRAGCVTTAAAALACVLSDAALADARLAAALSIPLAALASLLALRTAPLWVWSDDLRRLLRERAGTSALLYRLCSLIGLMRLRPATGGMP